MKYNVENLLSSGHHFSDDENLEKFRFSLLNTNLIVASFFSCLSYSFSASGFTQFDPTYEKILLFCTLVYALCIFPLRINKRFYWRTANVTLLNSLVLFYSALVTTFVLDEFRLIWFFLVVFASFVLMGKRYGISLMIFVLVSIGVINHYHDLGFSQAAQNTFVISFLIFAAFAYNFLNKIENDALEFRQLNSKLEDKVRKEVKQREQQEQILLQQYRMANIGGRLDAIAHQWRQPLMNINAILLNMDNALEQGKQGGGQYVVDKIEEVAALTQHMSQTIEDFRGLFKIETQKSSFFMHAAIEEILSLMKNSLKDVSIKLTAEPSDEVLGHKNELMQIVIILLSNAVEAFDKRKIKNKQVAIRVAVVGKIATVSIQDNAGGITRENITAIFDPYFTTKAQSGGTGLGLYIAKTIVEQRMMGTITAENIDNGARFTASFSSGLGH